MNYGTIARYRIKPGHEAGLLDQMKTFQSSPPSGWLHTTLFRSTTDPNDVWMSAVFESEELYKRNAESPEMGAAYEAMREHLEGEPEWHDGHVVHQAMRAS